MLLKSVYTLFCLFVLCTFCRSQTITPAGPVTQCGGTVTLTAPIPGTGPYQWFMNGAPVGANSNTYTANATGNYSVRLTISGSQFTTAEVSVTINPVPVANFSVIQNGQCSSLPVQFTDGSTGAGLTYYWSFNDPNSGPDSNSISPTPVHRFVGNNNAISQTFQVKLTVTNSFGCSHSIIKPVTISKPNTQLNEPGLTIFNNENYFTKCVSAPSNFHFTYQTIGPPNTSYTIKWGDNSPDFTSNVLVSVDHIYNVGIYQLQFIVVGQTCTDTAYYKVFVGTNPGGSISNPSNTQGCTGETFAFPFANVQTNPLGTIYVVSVNDGTKTDTFYQPPPAFYTHTFDKPSCGVSSNNFFTVTYTISNPCGLVPGSTGGIGISQKPKPAFIFSKDTACINTTVSLINKSPALSVVSSTGICSTGKFFWTITPATGWSVTLGDRGDEFTVPSRTGTDVVNLNFMVPGIYTVKLKMNGTTSCAADSITKTICVNPTPTASYLVDTAIGCAPFKVRTTTTTNTPTCGQYTYKWTYTYSPAAGCVPATGSVSYLEGTSDLLKEPVFQFNNPGTYTLILSIVAPASSCTTTVQKQIIVKGKANITSLGFTSPICQGVTINPIPSIGCYVTVDTSYAWSFIGGLPDTSNKKNPGSVIYNTAGTFPVSLKATNSCGDTTFTQLLTVKPVPDLNIHADTSFCPGEATGIFTFSSSLAGTIFPWTNSNTAIGLNLTNGSGNINSFTATNSTSSPILSTIKVTATNNGCTKQGSFTITVYPKPATPTVTTPVNYCVGDSSVPLTASLAAGNTLLWYTAATGGVGDTIPPKPATNVAGTFSWYVSQKNLSGCESNRMKIDVIVKPVPVITGSSFISPSTCGSNTGSITLTGLLQGSYTVRYTKNGTPVLPFPGTANALGVLIISNLSAGTYTNITVTLNGCPSNIVGPFVLSDPNPPLPPSAGGNIQVCSGGTLTLTATPNTASTGVITYTWTGPFSSPGQTFTITNVTTAASGKYYVTNTVNGCTSLADSVIVMIDSTPSRPTTTATSPVCEGDSIKLTASTYGFAVTYAWTGPPSFSSTIQNPFVPAAGLSSSGMYSVTVKSVSGNCSSLPGTATVIVRPVPVISSISSTDPLSCGSPTGTIVINGLSPGTAYTVKYTPSASTPTLTATAAGTITITGLTSGTYSNISVTLNSCTSNIAGPVTLNDPNPPAAPTPGSNGPLCTGDTLRLTSSPNITGGAYTWGGPNPFSSNLPNPVVANVVPAQSGKYWVKVTLNNCTSLADTINVVINPKPANPLAVSNSPVCSGDTIRLYADSATQSATLYTWIRLPVFSSNLQNPTIPNAGPANSGIYTVTAKLANCYAVSPGTVLVTVLPKPLISAVFFTNPTSCGTYTGSITLQGLIPGTTYMLRYVYNNGQPFNIQVSSNPAGVIILNNLPSGIYSNISVALNGCSSAEAGPFTLTDQPPPAPSINSNGPLCIGSNLQLTSSSLLAGVSYSWTGPPPFTSNQQNPVIPNIMLADSGTYTVTASLNGCSSSASIHVIVSPKAVGGFTGNDTTVCTGTNNGIIQLTGYTGSVTRWQSSINNGANWGPISNTTPLLAYANLTTTTWYRAFIESGSCPPAYSDTTKITVVSSVDAALAGPDQKTCNQQTVNLVANNPVIGKGVWTQTLGPTAMISNPASSNTAVTSLQPGQTYRFLWTITGATGCGSSADEIEIINRPPITIASAGPDQSVCDFTSTRTFALQANINAARPYEKGQWAILSQPAPGSASFSNAADPAATFTVIRAGVYLLAWTISNDVPQGCVPSADTLTISVSGKPVAGFNLSTIQLCTGQSVTANNTSTNSNVYQWLWGDGFSDAFTSGSHTYTAPGSYTVVLIAKKVDPLAVCTDTMRRIVSVVNIIPARISVAPGNPCVPYNLQLTALNAGAASLVEWKIFDHGVSPGLFTSTGLSASHTYNFAGSDSVRLIVHNQNGCADSTTYRFTVFNVPVTSFNPLTAITCSHDTAIVFNASTVYNGTDPINYRWFIDGQLKGNSNPFNYRFLTPLTNAAPVNYTIQLLAQNTGACGDTALPAKVTVQALPAAGIKVSPSNIQQQPDYTFTFEDTTLTNSFKRYTWSLGDRSLQTRSGNKVTYKYSDTGSYLVKLVTNDFATGCSNSDSTRVTILYIPGYVQVPNAICPGCSNSSLRQFLPLAKGLSFYRLRIYTTWGQVIFETSQLNPDGSPKEAWNGRFNGNPIQQDVYRWEIEARYINGAEWKGMLYPGNSKPVKSGFITIIK